MAITSTGMTNYTTNYQTGIITSGTTTVANSYPNTYTTGPLIGGYISGGGYWTGTAPYYAVPSMPLRKLNLSDAENKIDLYGFDNNFDSSLLYSLNWIAEQELTNLTYSITADNYFCLVENDFDDAVKESSNLADFKRTDRSMAVVAYDLLNNRLELSYTFFQDAAKSNIDILLDEHLCLREDTTEYFASLRSRFLPIVNYTNINYSKDTKVLQFEKNTKYGLLPIIHISNYLYNPLTTCYTNQQHKASSVLETINKEALLINKELLPQVQPRFTPEYAYISLLNADTIRQELNTFNKSKQGLVNLLTNITVPGTNISSFIECLLDVSGLNQNVMDVESYLYLKIRHLIEINIC